MTHSRIIVPFRSWHYEWLVEQGPAADQIGAIQMTPEALRFVEQNNTWTGVVDGDPICCAGTWRQWADRHVAWAYLGDHCGPHMRWITNAVLENISRIKGRIELTVRADYEAGHRWAKMLGFSVETPLLAQYGPEGEDHVGYVRVN